MLEKTELRGTFSKRISSPMAVPKPVKLARAWTLWTFHDRWLIGILILMEGGASCQVTFPRLGIKGSKVTLATLNQLVDPGREWYPRSCMVFYYWSSSQETSKKGRTANWNHFPWCIILLWTWNGWKKEQVLWCLFEHVPKLCQEIVANDLAPWNISRRLCMGNGGRAIWMLPTTTQQQQQQQQQSTSIYGWFSPFKISVSKGVKNKWAFQKNPYGVSC